ncbi:MAG: glycogen debranching enzyme N-terminal domain-containing protein, partial [Candidatus Bathyarchaeota archaeon]
YKVYNSTSGEVLIRISPLVNSRHFHSVTDKDQLTWSFVQRPSEHKTTIQPSIPLSALTIFSNDGQYVQGEGDWIEEIHFRVDGSRGESCSDDCFRPGHFKLQVASHQRKRLFVLAVAGRDEKETEAVLSSMPSGQEGIDTLHNRELSRRGDLLRRFRERHRDAEMKDWLSWLILATDSFIVNRKSTRKKSIIAGYHWFEDWGRDTLVSLPGLTLVTDRLEDAKAILLTFKRYCHKGIVPNRFPDRTGDKPDYNTVDATLWYINAVFQFLKYTGDFDFIHEELWNTLQLIIEHHVEGTLHKIRMEDNGLIVHGPQLTWMDAMINGSSVTPREGKAVEVQALWYNALRVMELLATHFNLNKDVGKYSGLAERARKAFIEEFWNTQEGCLFDVVNGEKRESSLRPNQIIAAALDFSMLGKAEIESVVETVWKRLWTTYGLRTLPQNDPNYVGKYLRDWNNRNRAYHNGTI